MNVEYITVPLEIKALDSGQFEGYGSTFGNVDLGGDVVMKGAFSQTLADYRKSGDWPQMFWMHNPSQIPGKWINMSEDEKGLKVTGELLPTSIGNDVKVLMKARAVKALSIGFSLDSPNDFEYKDGVRLIKNVNLWEVSPVSMPMNPKATINAVKSVRARLQAQGVEISDFKRDFEHWLRSKGLSKSQALTMVSRALTNDDIGFGLGVMPRLSGDNSGVMPEKSRRDAGEADGELERAAKVLNESLQDESIRREVSESKADTDEEFMGSLKSLEEDLVALGISRRWKRLSEPA